MSKIVKAPAGATAAAKLEHYRAQAHAYMAAHKCRWSEATLAVKRKFPEACEVFGAPEPAKR
jgi:hypothetical protein